MIPSRVLPSRVPSTNGRVPRTRSRRSLWNRRPKRRSQTELGLASESSAEEESPENASSLPLSEEASSLPQLPNISLTPNAVSCMVNASKFPGALIVRLHNFRPPPSDKQNDESRLLVTISDGTHSCTGLVFRAHKFKDISDCVISIRGYITSEANLSDRPSLVCITSFEILHELEDKHEHEHEHTHPQDDDLIFSYSDHRYEYEYVQGSTAGTFLATRLTEDMDLIGESSLAIDPDIDIDVPIPRWKQNASKVSEFLSQHFALRTLQHTEEDQSWIGSPSKSTTEALSNYTKAMREFGVSQLDRHAASLIVSEGDATAAQAIDRNRQTLEYALQCTDQPLNKNRLCKWHVMLMGDQPNPTDSGTIRTTLLRRPDSSVSCPPERIHQELDALFLALDSLESDLVPHAVTDSDKNSALKPITFAAAALFGIIDIHPFTNDNMQLSLIVLNWALRRVGLPFCINLFATLSQRDELIAAIERTRQNTCMSKRGDVSDSDLQAALRCAGLLSPIVTLLLDRISRAADEFGRLVSEKALLASEEADARAVRRARERQAAEGTCIICFDERPNIATLCCGRAVHLNCIAEWLSAHASCPQCRHELPSLPARNRGTLSIDEEDDSAVEQLLNYITNESTDGESASTSSSSSSSSASSSSTSSSSSSSTSSILTYNELHYRIHYGSEEDENESDTTNQVRVIGYEDLLNNSGSRSMETDLYINSRLSRDRIEMEVASAHYPGVTERHALNSSQSDSEMFGSFQSASLADQNMAGFADSSSSNADSRSSNDDEERETIENVYSQLSNEADLVPQSSGSFPRLSFLDPSLLNELQNVQQRNCDSVSFEDSGSDNEATDVDANDDYGPQNMLRPLAQLGPPSSQASWLIRDHFAFSDSEGYDTCSSTSEHSSYILQSDRQSARASRFGDPPAVCLQENCRNRAANACCNKKCGRCCMQHGFHPCERHSSFRAETRRILDS